MAKELNAIGLACPLPVVQAKQALARMQAGTLDILVDNRIAVENLRRFARSQGFSEADTALEGGIFRVSISKAGGDFAAAGNAGAGGGGRGGAYLRHLPESLWHCGKAAGRQRYQYVRHCGAHGRRCPHPPAIAACKSGRPAAHGY